MLEYSKLMKEKGGRVIVNLEQLIDKEKGLDLLHVPTQNLSLRERLRQRRQLEATSGKVIADFENAPSLIERVAAAKTEDQAQKIAEEFLQTLPDGPAKNMTIDYVKGLSLPEISKKYGIKYNTVAKHISTIRISELEPNLLFKANLTRVTRNNLSHLTHTNISLQTFRIAGLRYATEDQMKHYDMVKKVIDPALIDKGYRLLGDIATERDYSGIKKDPEFSSKIVKKYKRLYILPAVLREYQTQKKPRSIQDNTIVDQEMRDLPRNEVMRIRHKKKREERNHLL